MIFYTNKAAALYELKNYNDCITVCDKAIDLGKYNNHQNSTIGKVISRKGKAFVELKQYEEGLETFEEALLYW